MMSGGILEGDSLLVAGPSGTGKSVAGHAISCRWTGKGSQR